MPQQRYLWIDALRGLAILLVIAVHADYFTHGLHGVPKFLAVYGQMGVQLFFVVSAISLCYADRRHRDEPRAVGQFFIRRVLRLAPAYWLGIALYGLWLYQTTGRHDYFTPLNVGANLLLVHGFYPPANNTIIFGGWSIGTEMAFYLLFPLLWGMLRDVSARNLTLIIIAEMTVACLLLLLLAPQVKYGLINNGFLYFSILNQLSVFLMGMLAFKHITTGGKPGVMVYVMLAIGLAGNFYGFYRLGPAGVLMLAPSAGISFAALAIICAYYINDGRLCRLFARIGQVSYSIYIFHAIIAAGLSLFLMRSGISGPVLFITVFLLTVLICYPLARLSWRYVEKPGIALGHALARRYAAR